MTHPPTTPQTQMLSSAVHGDSYEYCDCYRPEEHYEGWADDAREYRHMHLCVEHCQPGGEGWLRQHRIQLQYHQVLWGGGGWGTYQVRSDCLGVGWGGVS